MKKIIGIDIGTTNIKGEIYGLDGNLIDTLSLPYKTYFERPDQAEQDANTWVELTIKILNNFFEKHDGIKSVGLSTQGGTLVPVDEKIGPLRRAITWMDARGKSQKEKILDRISLEEIYRITGWRLQSILPLLQISWLKENENELFKRIHRFMFVSDYVQNKLCGRSYMDYSNASITMLFDIVKKQWSRRVMDAVGVRAEMFSPVTPSNIIVDLLKNKDLHKNAAGVAMSNSAHDQYCAALGAGIITKGTVLLSAGTSWTIFLNTDEPFFNDYYYSPGVHAIPDKYGLISVIPTGGTVYNWFFKNFFEDDKSRSIFLKGLFEEEQEFLKSKNDCIFIPTFNGVFGPYWSDKPKGSFIKLGFDTSRKSMFKAVLEGVAFQLLWILESFSKMGLNNDSIKLIGGAAKSRIQAQIIADITGKNIFIPKDLKANYACKGAAIIGAVSTGLFKDFYSALEIFKEDYETIYPRQMDNSYYENKYKQYREAVMAMTD